MIKLIGAMIIVTATTLLGFYKSAVMKKRLMYLQEFKTAFNLLKSEINFARNRLESAFLNISGSGKVVEVFEATAESLEKIGIKNAWRESVTRFADKMHLTNDDIDVLLLLGNELGMTDRENQIKNIEYISELLNNRLYEAGREYETSARMYRSVGVLAGMFLAVILI